MTVSFLRLSSGQEVKEDGRVKGKLAPTGH